MMLITSPNTAVDLRNHNTCWCNAFPSVKNLL